MSLVEIIIEVLLCAVLLFGLISGYRKGFLKSILKPVRFFASLATAFWLADPISRSFFEPMINTPVTNQIKDYLVENCPQITADNAAEELPTLLKFAASILNVDVGSLSSEDTISEIVDHLASPIVHIVSVVLTFILVYFIAKLVFSLLISLLSSSMNSGVLSLPNKIFGCVFSFIFAVAIAWLFSVLFDFIVHSALFAETAWGKEFEGGAIYKFFNKTNPVDILLGF